MVQDYGKEASTDVIVSYTKLEQMLLNHGLAFYVQPDPAALAKMETLLGGYFPGESQWLSAVADLYGLVLNVGYDGQFLHVYSSKDENVEWIKPSLEIVTSAVEGSEWFRPHIHELAWSKDLDACLMLPKVSEPETE